MRSTLALFLTAFATGCTFDEGLIIENMTGTIVLDEEAATRALILEDGAEPEDVVDPRLIGPVYLGLYSSVEEGLEAYSHPSVGPQFQAGRPGDTYPYGGTTVGDIRYACFEALSCKIASGRFVDYDSMVDWFRDVVGTPITDSLGKEVTTGEFIRQTCFESLAVTSDEEVRITAEDRNRDDVIDMNDLDFVQRSDGKFEAEFIFWQQEYFTSVTDEEVEGPGFSLWAFMDAPSDLDFSFSTCSTQEGFNETEYNQDFFGGKQFEDVINVPSSYLANGDWVTGCPDGDDSCGYYVYDTPYDTPEIHINQRVQ
jgi:hypothetical protein